jgi:hypothetical protein
MLAQNIWAWPMKVTLGHFFRTLPKRSKPGVERLVLEVHEHGDVVLLRQCVDRFHLPGVAGEVELLFADAQGAFFEPLLDGWDGAREVGDFIGEVEVFVWVGLCDGDDGVDGAGAGVQPVRLSFQGRWRIDGGTGGEEDGLGDAHAFLVVEQGVERAAAVSGVLVDVDDRVGGGGGGRGGLAGLGETGGRCQGPRRRRETAGEWGACCSSTSLCDISNRIVPENHYLKIVCGVVMALCVGLMGAAPATEPEVRAEDMPRVKPTEPGDVGKTFKVKGGFRLELVAAEPLVVDPIAMCFDENGRLFVVEMRDYSERREEKLGQIRMLEDTDGDGKFDKSTVFLENLPWPTALFYYGGGVVVGAVPGHHLCEGHGWGWEGGSEAEAVHGIRDGREAECSGAVQQLYLGIGQSDSWMLGDGGGIRQTCACGREPSGGGIPRSGRCPGSD